MQEMTRDELIEKIQKLAEDAKAAGFDEETETLARIGILAIRPELMNPLYQMIRVFYLANRDKSPSLDRDIVFSQSEGVILLNAVENSINHLNAHTAMSGIEKTDPDTMLEKDMALLPRLVRARDLLWQKVILEAPPFDEDFEGGDPT